MIGKKRIKYNSIFTPTMALDQLPVAPGPKKNKDDIFCHITKEASRTGDNLLSLVNEYFKKYFTLAKDSPHTCSLSLIPINSLSKMDKSGLVKVSYWGHRLDYGIDISSTVTNKEAVGNNEIKVTIYSNHTSIIDFTSQGEEEVDMFINSHEVTPFRIEVHRISSEIIKYQLIYLHALCVHQRSFQLNEIHDDKNYSLN